MDSRITVGLEGLVEAQRRFEESVRLDPQFVRAHVGVASVQYLLTAYDDTLDVDEQLDKAEANARYALQLDPSSADALGVLGAILFRRGEALQSAALFNRAEELGNTDPNFVHWHALLFISMGYFERLVPSLEQAYRVDPLNPLLGCSLGSALSLSGLPRESVDVFASMTPFSRRNLGLGLSSIYINDYDTARSMLRGIELWSGNLPDYFADRLVDAFQFPAQTSAVEGEFIDAAGTGALDKALAFEALLILGSPRAFNLEVEFAGTPFQYRMPEQVWSNWGVRLRQDPRFKTWVRALGYEQYWRRHGWPDRCSPISLDDFECI
jgi:tetratricopeptide (TPR) repeat protein